jgi:SWI2/SNF2 ATPase
VPPTLIERGRKGKLHRTTKILSHARRRGSGVLCSSSRVKNVLARVKQREPDGRRRGGIIWHTQGSGKSLTMVMLARGLALDKEIKNARVILVTTG